MYWDSPPWPIWTIPMPISASETAMATEECQPDTIISTPSRLTASLTARTAFSGDDSLSTQINSRSRSSPSKDTGSKPCSRASSTAIIAPFWMASPVRPAGPVKGPMTPILTASWATASSGAQPAASATPVAVPKTRRTPKLAYADDDKGIFLLIDMNAFPCAVSSGLCGLSFDVSQVETQQPLQPDLHQDR